MAPISLPDYKNLLDDLVKQATRNGADAADAILAQGKSVSVAWHNDKIESVEHAEGGDLGLRVLIGKRQVIVSTTDHSPAALQELVSRAISMAKVAPEDPYCGLADPADITTASGADNQMADAYEIDVDACVARAREAEAAALSVEGVTQCESTNAGGSASHVYLAASNGFCGDYARTDYWISAAAVAGSGTAMIQDYEYDIRVLQKDLPDAAAIGRKAGQRAVSGLSPRKMPTGKVPVIFDPREARSLLGTFAGAINGAAIARGTSFLKDFMGKQVFASGLSIIDDPSIPLGLRSKPFDGEGITPHKRAMVEDGILQSWFLDLRSARRLGLKSTGHASRGTSSMPRPSPTNLYLQAGTLSPQDLMQDIASGFYVTELMGDGINDVTGDFSQAARGFWIENGQITFPVSEMTVAGNLKDMFLNAIPASDLTLRFGIDAPTLRIEGLTVAGV
ncbi:MAG: TldD/PmbA family protein [Alphaproteobacteria bacterium]|nr:TldD/PmbA family protein [Alphaproteobacteria bacterium]